MAELTWAETMSAITDYYLYFHAEAPGVTPKEVGVLGDLWRHADSLVERGKDVD